MTYNMVPIAKPPINKRIALLSNLLKKLLMAKNTFEKYTDANAVTKPNTI